VAARSSSDSGLLRIAGLAPQGRRIGRVMLCTIPSKKSVAWRFSDPQQKPSWNGKRYKLVDRWPDHPERWEEYMAIRSDDQRNGDPFGRRAQAYYLEHWEEMNAGAVVTNPYRFDQKPLPDGSQMETSTLEFVYNEIARTSREAFCAEYQNEVIDDLIEDSVYLTAAHVQKRVWRPGLGKVNDEYEAVLWEVVAGDAHATRVLSPRKRLSPAEAVKAKRAWTAASPKNEHRKGCRIMVVCLLVVDRVCRLRIAAHRAGVHPSRPWRRGRAAS
jgi:hypothetical protein